MSLPERIDLGDGFVLDRSRVTDADESARAIRESLEHLARYMPWATPEQATAEAQRERFARIEDEWQRSEHFDFIVRRVGERHVLGIVGLDWRTGRSASAAGPSRSATGSTSTGAIEGSPRRRHAR